MPHRIEFMTGLNTSIQGKQRLDERRYRIYVAGNFSAGTNTHHARKIIDVGIDNFDEVMASISPTLDLAGSTVCFKTLDDFHPDHWIDNIKLLADLRQLRRELSHPATAVQAVERIRALLPGVQNAAVVAHQPVDAAESQDALFERLLGKKPQTVAKVGNTLQHFIQQSVSPHVIQDTPPSIQALQQVIDATLSEIMKGVLHGPEFQRLEALWLATASLVQEAAADEHAIFLVDVTAHEILDDIAGGTQLIAKALLDHVQGAADEEDILLIGNDAFSNTEDDQALLLFWGELANLTQGIFLGAASRQWIDDILADETPARQHWKSVLDPVKAAHIALAYPRYLLRLPYGSKRDPLQQHDFEEIAAIPKAEQLLWGNPAFLCARALLKHRATASVEAAVSFDEIPVFAFEQCGEQVLQPATETIVTEHTASQLLACGISVVTGFRQRQGVRLRAMMNLQQRANTL